jgi:hypothetical protein
MLLPYNMQTTDIIFIYIFIVQDRRLMEADCSPDDCWGSLLPSYCTDTTQSVFRAIFHSVVTSAVFTHNANINSHEILKSSYSDF